MKNAPRIGSADSPDDADLPEAPPTESGEFERLSAEADVSLAAEFWLFLKEEKRWWLTPIILACLGITGLAWFSSTGAYPFIYSLF